MSFLRQELASENHSARKEASAIETELAEFVKITRNLSIDLSPPTLPGEGLSHAIEWLATRMREQYSLPVDLAGGSYRPCRERVPEDAACHSEVVSARGNILDHGLAEIRRELMESA
jgi:signal transduction histidine kinase